MGGQAGSKNCSCICSRVAKLASQLGVARGVRQLGVRRVATATRSRRWKAVNVPSFALKCLQKLGMPEPMIFACQHVWGQQVRYLQYRGCISATPSRISNSLPQGDALSVIALLAVLSMPTLDLRRQAAQDGEHVHLITFVDDRSFLTQNAAYAMTMINRWMQWSVDLGLVENDHKICVVARTTSAKATMLAYGAQEKWFVPTTRILGVDFECGRSPARPTALDRVNETLRRVQKVSFLPVAAPLKLEVLAYVALPKATWGCWFFVNMQQWASLQTAINKCMNFWRSPANPALTALLAGHSTQAKMRSILSCISALYRTIAKGNGPPWSVCPKLHTWQQTLAHHLRNLGRQNSGPWTWTHDECGEIDMTSLQGKDETMHRIRESCRRQLFASGSLRVVESCKDFHIFCMMKHAFLRRAKHTNKVVLYPCRFDRCSSFRCLCASYA